MREGRGSGTGGSAAGSAAAGVRVRVVAALVSAVAVVALSACSGGGERPSGSVTVASPTAAASASGPSTDVLLPPTLPPAASEHTVAGAEAAFRHFLDVWDYSFASGDSASLVATCSFSTK